MIIVPRNVKERTSAKLLKASIAYCEQEGASEIYNVAELGEKDFRIMYYMGEEPHRKMKAVLLKIPFE